MYGPLNYSLINVIKIVEENSRWTIFKVKSNVDRYLIFINIMQLK